MIVYVLLYESGKDSEGIHSLELNGETIVLMFENKDDADRYCGLLEAQDFPCPTVEGLDREEIEIFCKDSGYQAKFVNEGFVPSTEEERLLLAPPEANRDVSTWQEEIAHSSNKDSELTGQDNMDDIRKMLEGLL